MVLLFLLTLFHCLKVSPHLAVGWSPAAHPPTGQWTEQTHWQPTMAELIISLWVVCEHNNRPCIPGVATWTDSADPFLIQFQWPAILTSQCTIPPPDASFLADFPIVLSWLNSIQTPREKEMRLAALIYSITRRTVECGNKAAINTFN